MVEHSARIRGRRRRVFRQAFLRHHYGSGGGCIFDRQVVWLRGCNTTGLYHGQLQTPLVLAKHWGDGKQSVLCMQHAAGQRTVDRCFAPHPGFWWGWWGGGGVVKAVSSVHQSLVLYQCLVGTTGVAQMHSGGVCAPGAGGAKKVRAGTTLCLYRPPHPKIPGGQGREEIQDSTCTQFVLCLFERGFMHAACLM